MGIPKVYITSVMSMYEGAKTRVRVDSEEFGVKVVMPLLFLFAVVVDVTEFARERCQVSCCMPIT